MAKLTFIIDFFNETAGSQVSIRDVANNGPNPQARFYKVGASAPAFTNLIVDSLTFPAVFEAAEWQLDYKDDTRGIIELLNIFTFVPLISCFSFSLSGSINVTLDAILLLIDPGSGSGHTRLASINNLPFKPLAFSQATWTNAEAGTEINPIIYRLDNLDCQVTVARLLTVEGNPALVVSETHTDLTAIGANDGTIDITVTGGSGSYTYLWADGPTSQDRTGLEAGLYLITVTDTNTAQQTIFGPITIASPIAEVCGTDTPLTIELRGEGSENKFEPILATKVTLNLTAELPDQFLITYTNDPNELKILVYKNDIQKGTYKILPQQYQEDYSAQPNYVSILATDGLPELDKVQFLQDDGSKFSGPISQIKLIAFILKKTKLKLNIRVGINLYAEAMNQTDTDDPLEQAYVNPECYYFALSNPNLNDILKAILEPYGAVILQAENTWNIIRREEMVDTFDYREFDHDGELLTNDSFNPVVEINFPQDALAEQTMMFSDTDQHLELRPGYGLIRIKYNLGLKPNLLPNGDFRLKAVFSSTGGIYEYKIDTFGFQLVTGSEVMSESYELIDNENVAYVLTGPFNSTGNAYLLSENLFVRMGSNNTLRLRLKFKLPQFVGIKPLAGRYEAIGIPYQKVRVVVTYGPHYLTASGFWQTAPTELVFYITEFGKYIEVELIAVRPDEAAANGYDLNVKVYHSIPLHTEFTTVAGLKTKATVGLPIGTRSETIFNDRNYYYELEETTDAESIPDLVRPNDYNAGTNPFQWVSKSSVYRLVTTTVTHFVFYIDKIQLNFLVTGIDPVDTVIREQTGERFNDEVLELNVLHGSFSDIITTEANFDFIGTGGLVIFTTNVLSAKLLYTGYLMDAYGNGYQNWKRDNIDELTSMHAIQLKQYAAQYSRAWRRITGTLYSHNSYMSFISTVKEVNDNGRLYMPIALNIDDKNNKYSGEFLELMNVFSSAGTEPLGRAFTSGFTRGFT